VRSEEERQRTLVVAAFSLGIVCLFGFVLGMLLLKCLGGPEIN
jgi:hypothetical protein